MRIFQDISTSYVWDRTPVGIVRTEQRFAQFLLAQHDVDVGFCRFDRESGAHVEVPRDVVSRLVAPVETDAAARAPTLDAAANGSTPPLAFHLRARESLARVARRTAGRLPPAMQPDARMVAKNADALVRSLYWLTASMARSGLAPARRAALALRRPGDRARPEPSAPPQIPLGPDDLYVSMGLDWAYNDLRALIRLKRARRFRTLLYCYDLIPVRAPHMSSFDARDPYSAYFANVAHAADRIVAISQATHDDLDAFLVEVGGPRPPLSVVHLGTDLTAYCADPRPPLAELVGRPFVLCVGTIEVRKNHQLLYNLWDRLTAAHGPDAPTLVLVGIVGWGVGDLLHRLRVNRRVSRAVVMLHDVPDGELLWLYQHCLFTVFPSFYEGWGLPVAESLGLGVPCIVSTTPSLLEVAQGVVPALDPLDFGAWHAQVESWAFDPSARRVATERVRTQYRPRTWEDFGQAMLDVCRDTMEERPCASST